MHQQIHMEPSMVAMAGAGILIVISGLEREFYLASVEWETLLFFAGLFVMVGALVRTGVIKELAKVASNFAHGDAWTATMLILTISFTLGQLHQQRSVRGRDDTDRRAIRRLHPRARRFRRAVVGPAAGHRDGRQPHPGRRQREHRRGRDRERARASRLVLGLHQTRSGGDRRVVRAVRSAICGCATSPSSRDLVVWWLCASRGPRRAVSHRGRWIPTPSTLPA